jgi:hypothetical protein
MNRLKKIAGIGALMLTLAGCTDKPYEALKPRHAESRKEAVAVAIRDIETFSELEGRIVKVQPSQFLYRTDFWRSAVSVIHEFEYVMLETHDKRIHTLIYPYSKAILERDATIKFRRLNSGNIDASTFGELFLPRRTTVDNILIEAEGLIIKDGINYKSEQ